MKWFIILLVIILALFILLFSAIRVSIVYKDEDFKLSIKYMGIRLTPKIGDKSKEKYSKPTKKKQTTSVESFEEKLYRLDEKINAYKEIIQKVLQKFSKGSRIKKLVFMANFGTGDAASCGILSGLCWAVCSNVFSMIISNIQVDEHKMDIRPDFNNKTLKLEFESIIETRPVHIINIISMVLFDFTLWKLRSLKKL